LNTFTLKEVRTNAELRRFINYPFNLYRGNPYWVPSIRSDLYNTLHWKKNPAFEFCEARYWLALKDGREVGRIAGLINHHAIEKWGKPYARFSWIDFEDDPAIAGALLGAVEDWARAKGLKGVHGPLGFTDLDGEGMLVEGFDQLDTMATFYNFPYYPPHMESAGYRKDVDWVEYLISVPAEPIEKIDKLAAVIQKRLDLRFLEVKHKKELLPYAVQLFELLDETYEKLYGTTPLTLKQKKAYIDQYFGFISPDFVPVIMDKDGRMAAFGIAMPSLAKALQRVKGRLFPFGFVHLLRALRKNDRGELYLIGVRPDYQGKGVTAMLISRMVRTMIKFGISEVESTPELEDNLKVQTIWKHFVHRQHKRRRVYLKRLED
jgi:GNAT superfamily N-acetyltransferase